MNPLIKNQLIWLSGMKTLIEGQKALPGDINFTLVQFDTVVETVYEAVPIKDIAGVSLVPGGGTALLDAMGKTITSVGNRLSSMKERDRPDLVMIAVVTDGEENSSRFYRREKIKEMVEHQASKYNWEFTLIGSNQDSFLNGQSLGFNQEAILQYTEEKTSGAFSSLNRFASGMACARSAGLQFAGYSEEDRSASV